MKRWARQGVLLLYTCLGIFCTLGVLQGTSRTAMAEELRCEALFQKSFTLPLRQGEGQFTSLSESSIQEILKNPVLPRGSSIAGLRFGGPEGSEFLILNLGRLRRMSPDSLEMDLAKEYLTEFIPGLYRLYSVANDEEGHRRLGINEQAIQGIRNSFYKSDFVDRTVLVMNITKSDGGRVGIRGGMGIIVAEEGRQLLPLEVDVPNHVLGFRLRPQAAGTPKRAEIVRTGIGADISDPQLFERLVNLVKSIVVTDPQIGDYYFHTTRAHYIAYRRKIRSLKPVQEFKSGEVDELVAVVERQDLLAEFGR